MFLENTILFEADVAKDGRSTPEKKKKNLEYCKECRKRFASTATYKDHMVTAHSTEPKQFKCQCGKSFHLKRQLKQHEYCHQTKKEFKCETCDKRISSKSDLQQHKIVHDPSLSKYKCDKCGKGFLQKSRFNQHVKLKHQPPGFKCNGCQNKFLTKYSLELHVKAKHTDPKELPFHCKYCDTPNPDKHRLAAHEKTQKHKANVKQAETQRMMIETPTVETEVVGLLSYRGISSTNPEMMKSYGQLHSVDTGFGTAMGDTQFNEQ